MSVGAILLAAPFVFPRADVVVTYGISGTPGIQQTLMVEAATGKERLDAPGGGLSIITDTVHGTAIVIDRNAGTFVRESAPGGAADMRNRRAPDGAYAETGTSRVAGLDCTDYVARSQPAGNGTVPAVTSCFTADGILLRAEAAGRPALVALSVRRGPVDPALFAPPSGDRDVTPPP